MKNRIVLILCIIFLFCCFGVTVSAATNTTKTTITTLQEKAEGKIYITWSKKSVDGYQVRWALNSKMTGAKSASFTETEMYRSGLIGGKTYYFQVRTYKKVNGKKVYSNWSAMRSIKLKKLPPTTSITSLTANSSSKFTVKWNKKANVKGYQIRYSTDSSFKTKKTASTNGTSITRSGLSKGTYYVSVRTYNIASDGTKYYSNWSGMKSIKIEYAESQLKAIMAKRGTIGLWGYADYDGNGTKEAFAAILYPDGDGIQGVYFIDVDGLVTQLYYKYDQLAMCYGARDPCTVCVTNYAGKNFFHVDNGGYGSGYNTLLLSVKNGKPYILQLSRKIQGFIKKDGIIFTTENDFSKGYHTYPMVQLIYNSSTQEFTKGKRIGEWR